MEPNMTGKRIVSKREYVWVQVKRMSVMLLIAVLFVLVLYPYALALSYILSAYRGTINSGAYGVLLLLVVVFTGAVAYCLVLASRVTLQRVEKTLNVVPLTHANIADLPAPESLVRASSEPPQAQESVLLRAAAEGQKTPPEELVRAVNGHE